MTATEHGAELSGAACCENASPIGIASMWLGDETLLEMGQPREFSALGQQN